MIKQLNIWFGEYVVQAIGLSGLIAAFVFAIMNAACVAWCCLGLVGMIDLYLIYVRKDLTITRWVRGLTGHQIDNIIMLSLVVACWILKGEMIALWFLLGLLNNHLFERDEQNR